MITAIWRDWPVRYYTVRGYTYPCVWIGRKKHHLSAIERREIVTAKRAAYSSSTPSDRPWGLEALMEAYAQSFSPEVRWACRMQVWEWAKEQQKRHGGQLWQQFGTLLLAAAAIIARWDEGEQESDCPFGFNVELQRLVDDEWEWRHGQGA